MSDHHHHSHDHDHHHEHHVCGHGHSHHAGAQQKQLVLVFCLTLGYLVIQYTGSVLSNSLALLADSGHMLGDTISIGIALLASRLTTLRGNAYQTFGYARLEILAALVNGLLLGAVAIGIWFEAVERFTDGIPSHVEPGLMLPFALGGLVINLVAAWILHRNPSGNLNLKGAYLHVISDLMGSIAALLAGVLMLTLGWTWADSALSMLIAILVGNSSFHLVKDAANVLMEGVPSHLKLTEVHDTLVAMPNVKGVHNLHVWRINSEQTVLSAHVLVAAQAFKAEVLTDIQTLLTEKFHFNHMTLQLEVEDW